MMNSKVITNEWGRVVLLSKGDIEIQVTIDKGPRVISLRYKNSDNIFFEDLKDEVIIPAEKLTVFGENDGWHIYGGHRFWVAPETDKRTYYPDNEKVDYKEENGKFIFTSNVEKWNNLQKQIVIDFEDETVILEHRLTNCGPFGIECAAWSSTAMKAGGIEVIPQCEKGTGLAANTAIAVWPYTKLNDSRFTILNDYLLLKPDENDETPFKIAYFCEQGWASYINNNVLFKKQFSANVNGKYPSYNCNIETYTCKDFLEMESIGEMVMVQPEETITHTERWTLKEVRIDGELTDEVICSLLGE